MSVISSLKVLLTADTMQFRKSLAQTGESLRKFESDFGSILKMGEDFAKLGGTGIGETFRAPDSGQFVSATKAMELYFDRVNLIYDALGNLRTQIEENNGALNRQSVTQLALANSAANAAQQNQLLARSTALVIPAANTTTSVTRKLQTSLRGVIASATDAASGLNYFGLVNYDVRQSVESWNWASVIRGPGQLVAAYDRLRQVLFGIVPPMRLLQKIMISLVVPALMAIKEALDRSGASAGRFTGLLADNLEKAAFEIQNLGQSYKRTLGTGLTAAFQIATGLSAKWAQSTIRDVDQTIAAFQRIPGAIRQAPAGIQNTVSGVKSLASVSGSIIPGMAAIGSSISSIGNNVGKVVLVRGALASIVGVASSAALSLAAVAASAVTTGTAASGAGVGIAGLVAGIGLLAVKAAAVGASLIAFSTATIGIGPTILAAITAVGGFSAAFSSIRAAGAAFLNLMGRLTVTLASFAASIAKTAIINAFRASLAAVQTVATSLISALTRLPALISRVAVSAAKTAANVLTLGMAFRKTASDADVATKSIKQASSAAGGGSKAFQGFAFGLSSLGPGVGIMASMGPVAAGAFGAVAAAVEGIKSAANFEQVNIAFETMLKDANQAKKTLGELQGFADATPFDTTETINAGKALLAFGFAADELIPNLTRIGDVASGVGVDFGELATLFGQFKAQSKIMTQDLRQLTSRGIPILEELAKQFNVPTEAIFKMAEEGQIGFEHIDAAFKNMTAAGGQFAGLMQKQSQTVGGLWSTLSSTVVIAVRDIGTAIIEGLNVRAGLAGLIAAAQWISSTAVPLFTQGLTVISGLISTYVTPAFEFMADVIISNVDAAQGFMSASFTAISEIVGTAVGYVVSTVQAGWGFVSGFIQQTFGVDVIGVFNDFAGAVSYAFIMGEYVMKNWQTVVELAIASALLSITTWANDVEYFLTESVPKYLDWFGRNWTNIFMDIFNGTVAIFSNLGTNLKNFFTEFWNFISSGGTAAFNFTWQPLLDGFKATTEQLPEIAARQMTDVEKNLSTQVDGLAGQLVQGFDAFYKGRVGELERKKQEREQQANLPPEPPKLPDAAKANAPPPREPSKKKGAQSDPANKGLEALTVGSSEALKLLANNRGQVSDKQVAREALKEQKSGNRLLRDINKSLKESRVVEFGIGGA